MVRDIEKFPGSFFDTAMKELHHAVGIPVKIQRDAEIFSYVQAFLVSGALPRENGKLALDPGVVQALKGEAEFFKLSALMKECEIVDCKEGLEARLGTYKTIRDYLVGVYDRQDKGDGAVCEYPTEDHAATDLVVVLSTIQNRFCVKDKLALRTDGGSVIYKSSTLGTLNISELLAGCQEPVRKETDTVRRSWEIPAAKLEASTLKLLAIRLGYFSDLRYLAANQDLDLRPNKLAICQEGGHFDANSDTVRGDGHIGTLVLILNSEYTGGELEITHNGQTEVVTGPYSWVAMYGDCLHKINPVTSGTRVSLIFDVYAGDHRVNEGIFWRRRWVKHCQVGILGISPGNRTAIVDGARRPPHTVFSTSRKQTHQIHHSHAEL
jgi:hypothetical protein